MTLQSALDQFSLALFEMSIFVPFYASIRNRGLLPNSPMLTLINMFWTARLQTLGVTP
jgi:hypothetical protein